MTSQVEFSSRAALCRELAALEPASRVIWLAEADYWAGLSQPLREETGRDGGRPSGAPGSVAAWWTRLAKGFSSHAPTRTA